MYVCMYVCLSVCLPACMYVCMYVCMYSICVYIYTYIHPLCMSKCIHVYNTHPHIQWHVYAIYLFSHPHVFVMLTFMEARCSWMPWQYGIKLIWHDLSCVLRARQCCKRIFWWILMNIMIWKCVQTLPTAVHWDDEMSHQPTRRLQVLPLPPTDPASMQARMPDWWGMAIWTGIGRYEIMIRFIWSCVYIYIYTHYMCIGAWCVYVYIVVYIYIYTVHRVDSV